MTSTNELRRSFLEFFAGEGHRVVPSAPLVPYNDPTLMFVNAGMVPFKNAFTGLEQPPASCATSSQKCVRAGGKHNDLDNVGFTARHHTFFEMLGNFSFGDYFKEQAIVHAWNLLTREWKLPADRLTVTVFHTDDEAFSLWRKVSGLPDDRIIRIATADNFWSMGDTGPCGPCSEIFYDHGEHVEGGPPGSANEDGDRFVEIWNLVFMQFEQANDGSRTPLPKPSIDTGMGLERVAAVMQGVSDNYDIDLFRALIAASENLTNTRALGDARNNHRIIADHLRSISFLLADGVMPSNEGRGYVLRRIMRRAMRHAHLLGVPDPLMHRLVPALVAEMGQAYPELGRAQPVIEDVLEREERQFRRTLDKGLRLLDEATSGMRNGDRLDGATAFRLYDTYGFPYDLTEDALRTRGLHVDKEGFDAAMAEQKAAARAAWKGSGEAIDAGIWFDIVDRAGPTEFTGYTATVGDGLVVAILQDGAEVDDAGPQASVQLLTNQTPFYAESGGQTGDTGTVSSDKGLQGRVTATSKPLGRLHVHHVKIDRGTITRGNIVHLDVDVERRDKIKANHSATHLLQSALRDQLGEHVTQKGSSVAPDRLRFDFSHPSALTAEDIAAIEREVNREIRDNNLVNTRLMTQDDAIAAGALALFGEKYGDEVRVLSIGKIGEGGRHYSIELCGGTHVDATGDIAIFRIISESAVASGVRRIEAVTGEAARNWLVSKEEDLKAIATSLRTTPEQSAEKVRALLDERKQLERELEAAKRKLALSVESDQPNAHVASEMVAGTNFSSRVLHGVDPKALRNLLDETTRQLGSGIAAIVAVNDGRAALAIAVTEDLSDRFDAVELVRIGVTRLGGKGGGGRRDMAQGGGPDGSNALAAIDSIRQHLAKAVVAG